MLTKKSQKSLEIFLCEICDYRTSKIYDYNKHLSTRKHKMLTNVDKKSQKVAENFEPINGVNIFECVCGKKFAYRQSLSVHKKKCLELINNNEPISKELVMQLIKQNQTLQDMLQDQHNKMFELAKEGKNITNNTTNNAHFNLNVFLNEECKDAVNLMDFIDSLNIQLKDLEYTARVGYAEGISQILIKALSDLKVHNYL